jgi:hypothetical protein
MYGSNADVKISNPGDWEMFHQQLLDVIVDPMVFRSAEIFFRGKKEATKKLPIGDAQTIWKALSGDLGSLTAFFDQIILSRRLPIIDYGVTFDSAGVTFDPGFDPSKPWISEYVNDVLDDADAVKTVHVQEAVSKAARTAALSTLAEKRPADSVQLVEEVSRQLTTLNYQWRPDLVKGDEDLPAEKRNILKQLVALPEKQLTFVRFLYGGLLFSAFCQMSRSLHVLQPKRWQLLTAASIDLPSAAHEEKLVAELDSRIRNSHELYRNLELGSLPSFLPYLLSLKPESPRELLHEVKELRKDPEIDEYRIFRSKILRNWVKNGEIDPDDEKGIKHAALKIYNKLKMDKKFDASLEFGPKIGLEKDGFKGIALDGGIKVPVPIDRIWGWILEKLPGHRYIKVLTRLKLAEHRYPKFERYLEKIWSNA